jgi:tetratricopeptide (TPR) repeat protein
MSRRFLIWAIALSIGLGSCNRLATNAAFNEGIRQQQARNYPAAYAAYSQALQRDPKLEQAYYRRGQVAQQMGDDQRAIADFQAATQLNPKLIDAYYRQGLSELNLKRWVEAEQRFSKVITLYYDDGNAYFQRGRSRAAQNKFDGALGDFTFASALYLRQNQPDQADLVLKELKQLFTRLCIGPAKSAS